MQGRDSEAEAILNRLHSDSMDPENAYARAEFFQIVRQIHIDKTLGNSWVSIIRKPSYRKRAFIAMAVTFFCQSSGDLVINSQFTKWFGFLYALTHVQTTAQHCTRTSDSTQRNSYCTPPRGSRSPWDCLYLQCRLWTGYHETR